MDRLKRTWLWVVLRVWREEQVFARTSPRFCVCLITKNKNKKKRRKKRKMEGNEKRGPEEYFSSSSSYPPPPPPPTCFLFSWHVEFLVWFVAEWYPSPLSSSFLLSTGLFLSSLYHHTAFSFSSLLSPLLCFMPPWAFAQWNFERTFSRTFSISFLSFFLSSFSRLCCLVVFFSLFCPRSSLWLLPNIFIDATITSNLPSRGKCTYVAMSCVKCAIFLIARDNGQWLDPCCNQLLSCSFW